MLAPPARASPVPRRQPRRAVVVAGIRFRSSAGSSASRAPLLVEAQVEVAEQPRLGGIPPEAPREELALRGRPRPGPARLDRRLQRPRALLRLADEIGEVAAQALERRPSLFERDVALVVG